jgi:2-polyprenyl-3-methyl-5-hydroxy-6-metoxy-1,4-benzoquinol methylase
MGIIGGALGYKLLRRINPGGAKDYCDGSAYANASKLEVLFTKEIWREIADKVVIDFGCGAGSEAIEMATRGAKKVIGIDIRESLLERARRAAEQAGVAHLCEFTSQTDTKADVLFSIDSFEHFQDPAAILKVMRGLVKDDGKAIIEFGPPWYHPLGGHIFSVLPWAHLIFSEKSLLRWRSDFKTDGAKRFTEIEGGLNQMTVRRFKRLVGQSDFQFAHFEAVPIRKAQFLLNPFTEEFFTAIVRCRLVPRNKNLDFPSH